MLINSTRTIFSTLTKFYKYGIPSHVLSFGESLGDNLLLTTLAKGLYDAGFKKIWIKCDHRFLFDQNPHVKLVMPFKELLSTHLLKLFSVKVINPAYTEYNESTDRDRIPEKHIILKMADAVGLKGSLTNKPDLYLSDAELAHGLKFPRQIVIVTSSRNARVPMRNKEWLIERYQAIVDKFFSDYRFIQLGAEEDSPLDHVLDLRGKTSVRESAAILSKSLLVISHVGFMMHLARAVDCRSVIIYGGRERPDQSGYACFENIYSAVPCSPCWQHNRCDFNHQCMAAISAQMVEEAVLKQLSLAGEPLAVDLLYND
jgi:hypothetical protein